MATNATAEVVHLGVDAVAAAAADGLCEIPTGSSSHFRYLEGDGWWMTPRRMVTASSLCSSTWISDVCSESQRRPTWLASLAG